MEGKTLKIISGPLGRRRFLQGSAAVGATSLLTPRFGWASEPGVLRVRSYADLETTDPAHSTGVNDEEAGALVHSKLIQYRPGSEWGWQPDAAESIEQIDPLRIAFKLRPGIMFTGGFGEMTAEDVKFSFERIVDEKTQSPNKPDWGPLDKVEVTDKYSGVIVFKEPFPPAWNIALPYISGTIVSKKAVEQAGGRFGVEAPAYSGPYVVKEWSPNQRTVFVRNEQWTGPKPAYERIEIYPIDDEKTAEIAFEAGDIDFTRVSISSIENLMSNPPAASKVEVFPSLYYVWVGLNLDNPKFEDARVREAVQRSIDVPAILDAAYFGVAKPSTGIIAPGLIGHRDASLIPPEADPERSRKLLDEAGIDTLDVKLAVLNKSQWVTAAQVIQAMCQPAGINVQIDQYESGTFWSLGDESKNQEFNQLEMIMNRFSMTPDPYYATAWFTCDQVGVWNWERFCNERFDALHTGAASETDPAKRDAMYREAQDLMEQSGAYRFITHEATPNIYRTNIKPALRPDGLPLLRYFMPA